MRANILSTVTWQQIAVSAYAAGNVRAGMLQTPEFGNHLHRDKDAHQQSQPCQQE